MPQFNPSHIKLQIDQLFLQYPDLQEDEILRADMLEGSTDLNDFLRATERKRQEAVSMAEAIDINMEALNQRRNRFKHRDEALRSLMFKLLEWGNLKRVELPEATISIRAGTPRVVIVDEAAIPDALCRFRREPDKVKIKAALADGEVNGAALSNAEPTISIRVK